MSLKVLLLLANTAQAATVEVSPGDDLAALTSSLQAGDVVSFEEGIYPLDSRLNLSELLGTEDAPIVLEGIGEVWLELSGSGRTLVLSDSSHVQLKNLGFRGTPGAETQPEGLQIARSDDILVEDCRFEDLGGTAIYFSGDTDSAVIRGNRIQRLANNHGIYLGCSDASCWSTGALVEQNLVTDLSGEWSQGIVVENGGTDNTVRDNVVADITGIGIRVRSTEYSDPNVVEGNAVWQTWEGMVIEGAAVVRNNVVFCTEQEGIIARATREAFEEVVIANNTVVDTGEWAIYLEDWELGSGHVLANNALSNPVGQALYLREPAPDALFIGNIVTGLVQGLEDGFVPGGGFGDFLDVEHAQLYPSQNSPLLAAGEGMAEAWVPAQDFNGVDREGTAPGVGAYEWVHPENPGWWIQKDFKELGYDETLLVNELEGCGGGRAAGLALVAMLGLLGLGRWRETMQH